MSATTEPSTFLLIDTRKMKHPRCVVCGPENKDGLDIEFYVLPDGSVEANFSAPQWCEGYGGLFHGGISSTILDGAMTNCLFAHGITAVTAELNVRFRHKIFLDSPIRVRAWIIRDSDPLYILNAQIEQGKIVKATSTGKFMENSESQ